MTAQPDTQPKTSAKVIIVSLIALVLGTAAPTALAQGSGSTLVGWNDLGMHDRSKRGLWLARGGTDGSVAFKKRLVEGTGTKHPTQTSTVTVHYSGWTTDGPVESDTEANEIKPLSDESPFNFPQLLKCVEHRQVIINSLKIAGFGLVHSFL